MKKIQVLLTLILIVVSFLLYNTIRQSVEEDLPLEDKEIEKKPTNLDETKPPIDEPKPQLIKTPLSPRTAIKAKPIPDYLEKGIDWLVDSQFENGGWGAGQHVAQNVKDPKSVQIDPATTAFSAMALMRVGNTLQEGKHKTNLKKALVIILETVESSDKSSANITNITGTQPQNKLGQNIDVAMVAQFLGRILPLTSYDQVLYKRTKNSLSICVVKIENSQHADGSWNDRGWAPVLQSAMANNALEISDDAGIEVKKETLEKSKSYQTQNISASGTVKTEKAAGIELYALSSTQRTTAKDANKVKDILKRNDKTAILAAPKPTPEMEEETKELLLADGIALDKVDQVYFAYQSNEAASAQLQSDAVLSGFGNNGGEEFLSYMMTSESLVESGDEDWDNWHKKMNDRLGKVQNANGSWSGHHCITSPVFCTAAVILTLTADRDIVDLQK